MCKHPLSLLRSRASKEEFTYLGDATVRRPDPPAPDAEQAFHDYVYLRDNPSRPARGTLVSRRRLPPLAGGDAQHAHP